MKKMLGERHSLLPARRIIRAIHDAAERWSNADFPPRVRATAALIERTGYREPVIDYALDRLFSSISFPILCATIAGELGSVDALDGFVARSGGRPAVYARGLRQAAIIASRTTVGVALAAAVFALAAKNRVLVKDREDGLIRSFFATLIEEEPALADAALAEVWDGSDSARLSEMDIVVAFGGAQTLREIRNSLRAETRFVGFGPRVSCGVLSEKSLVNAQRRDTLLTAAARDVVLYEAEGCMSLHVLFVQEPGSANKDQLGDLFRALTAEMARALDLAHIEFPPAHRLNEEALRVASSRSSLRFRAAANFRSFSESANSCVVVDPEAPPPLLPGTLLLVPVANAAAITAYLHRHHLRVEAVSSDPLDPAARALALATNAVRLTSFGMLQNPPLLGEHGGRPRILDFVEMVSMEAVV